MPLAVRLAVRPMSRHDLRMVLDWAAAEGWNPGLRDAETFFAADPGGFLLAEADGEPVGGIAAVNYDERFGFAGLLAVRPEHRGARHGAALLRAALHRFGGRTIGLDGVIAKQRVYRTFGFRAAYRTIRYEASAGPCDLRAADSPAQFVDLRSLPLANLVAYEAPMFPASRPQFLQSWIHQPGTIALGLRQLGRLVGYGVLRPCHVGCRVGPLFADHQSLAELLLEGLLAAAPGANVYLDVPEPNLAAVALARRRGMKPCFRTVRMYRGAAPDIDLGRVYGVTSLELG